MRTAGLIILALGNIAFAVAALYFWRASTETIYVEHTQGMRLDFHSKLLHVQLANSEDQTEAVLTPRAAIELHHEITRMFAAVEQAARKHMNGPSR